MTEVTMTLPDNLAKEARAAGLLTPQAVEAMLRERLRDRRVDELCTAMANMAQVDMPMTEAEIQAESRQPGRNGARVVLDTNTVVSGLLWGGTSKLLLNAARERPLSFLPVPRCWRNSPTCYRTASRS